MNEFEQLEEIVAVHGADPSRWPAGREMALHDVAQSDQGRALLEEAAALESTLNVLRDAPSLDSSALLGSIMAATVDAPSAARGEQRGVGRATRLQTVRRGWISAAAVAAALLVGVFAGINGIGAVVTADGVSLAGGETVLSGDDALLADLAFSSELDLGDDV